MRQANAVNCASNTGRYPLFRPVIITRPSILRRTLVGGSYDDVKVRRNKMNAPNSDFGMRLPAAGRDCGIEEKYFEF